MKKIKILSIDGGGIRGILPGVILTQLEKKYQEATGRTDARLAHMFDFMAGTSTGGILTLVYLMPNKKGHPKYTAQDAVDFYLKRGDKIFDRKLWKDIVNPGGAFDEKYSAKELEKAFEDTFGDTEYDKLLKPCIITSYDIENARPQFFSQHEATNDIHKFKVRDIARATSAAPTYFEPALAKNAIGTPFALVDGGVFANNPALVAYSEVRAMTFGKLKNPTAEHMMIVSIGTGGSSKKYPYDKAKDWGAIGWIKPVLDMMMTGNSQTVNHHLEQIYGTIDGPGKDDYYRLEPKLISADSEMDNAEPANMNRLREDALRFLSLEVNDKLLDEIVKKLIKYGEKEVV